MYLESFDIRQSVYNMDDRCNTVHAEASSSMEDIMPYLNAVLHRARYNPETGRLNFTRDGVGYSLVGREAVLTRLPSPDAAIEQLAWLKELINDTHEKMDAIAPNYQERRKITVLEILGRLPKTNCGRCGEAACMAFALKLLEGKAVPEGCPPLAMSEHRENRDALHAML